MRAIVQRVSEARVEVEEGRVVGSIGRGLMALVGFAPGDEEADLDYITRKIVDLRIFEDAEEKMNLSVRDVGGALLLVPNFTIHADCRRGRRPSFTGAAPPEQARVLFERFLALTRTLGVPVEA
ncbi:MAG: D-aminoacyl-tRNA deacylase, partial [Armatimonadota bacterium]